MNRPIKFRAWDKIDERMVHSGLNITQEGQIITGKRPELLMHSFEVMQYTGLKDKNGVEIYEGDIVDAWSQGQNAKCEVKWGQGPDGFFLYRQLGGIAWNLSGGGPDYTEETVEVIGNIYENPELLEAKQ